MITLPDWLTAGEPGAVYYPRRRTELAEAWPVIRKNMPDSGLSILVTTETGEIRFRAHDLSPIGYYTREHAPMLLPMSDERVAAAKERTDVMRVVHAVNAAIANHRASGSKTTDEIIADFTALLDALSVACDDVTDLMAMRYGR